MQHLEQVENKTIKGVDYSQKPFPIGEYDDCNFINCVMSNLDLSHCVFTNCEFENCDLSLSKLNNTAFRTVLFKSCKLMGLHFEDTNEFLFEVTFQGSMLNLSSFYGRKAKKTKFENCSLHEVDFAAAELVESVFHKCDLTGAMFDQANLEKCDFRTATNFIIDPIKNRVKNARFSENSLIGLLYGFGIKVT